MRILVIEDDPKIARFVRDGLEAEGHRVDLAHDGEAGSRLALTGEYELILLDLMLPELGGLELLRRLRRVDPTTPVIVLTARGEVEDRVEGLELGADDYLTKPFSFLELRARIRSLFRRVERDQSTRLQVGGLVLDRPRRRAEWHRQRVDLSNREFLLLEFLMRTPGEPVTRAMIADRVWGHQFDTGTNVVEVYVNYLRKKLKQLGVEPIRTLRGIGYLIDPAACEAPA